VRRFAEKHVGRVGDTLEERIEIIRALQRTSNATDALRQEIHVIRDTPESHCILPAEAGTTP
jgi:hypothetical protein